MGKRLTQQARGKGGPAFKVRPRGYRFKITYPAQSTEGSGTILKLIHSPAHSAPLAKISSQSGQFFVPAANGTYVGQSIFINGTIENGSIAQLRDIPQGTKVFNIENHPGSGGKILRGSGTSGIVMNKEKGQVEIIIRRRRIKLNEHCRAIVGIVAGDGRKLKPIIKAGNTHHMKKAQGRKWHRTSAVKTNAIDHPFGGGRGKRIKSKISKRNSSPGQKVGHISPRRTGKRR